MSAREREELQRQVTMVLNQQDRVVNLRIDGELEADVFAKKQTELRDRLASLKLQLDAIDRSNDEMADLVSKVFELSQTLREKWLTADYHCKRRILEIICLNFRLDDVTLCFEMRKPFDVLVEGLPVQSSRGDRRLTFPNDPAGTSLFWSVLSQTIEFTADTFLAMAEQVEKA